jgi:hypothetical protein
MRKKNPRKSANPKTPKSQQKFASQKKKKKKADSTARRRREQIGTRTKERKEKRGKGSCFACFFVPYT